MEQLARQEKLNPKPSKNKRYFIVLICMLIQAIPYCIAMNLQSQIQVPVSQSGVVSEVGFTLLYLSGTIPVLFNPLITNIYEKFKIKYIYIVGLVIAGLSFASYGLAQNSLMFNASAFFTQVGTILFTGLSLPVMMAHWFPGEGRGTALGIALAGGSLGNVFLQPVVVNLLSNIGWRQTYIVLGIAMIVIGVPLALAFIRFPKEGEAVVKTSHKNSSKPARVTYEGLSDKENNKNKYFWTFCLGALFICFACVAVSTQAIPVLITKGYEGSKLAIAGSIFGVSCLVGNVAGGKLFDKLGSLKPMILSGICTVASLLIMAFMPEGSSLGFLVPVLSGLTIYTITSGPAFIPSDVFGHKDGTIKMAKVGMFYALGSSVSALLFTVISGTVGLQIACIVFLIVGLIGYVLSAFAIVKSKQMFLK